MSDDLIKRLCSAGWCRIDSAGKRWVDDAPMDAVRALVEKDAEIARLRAALADPRVAARTICDEILQKPSVAAAEMRMSMIKATLGVKVPALTSVVRWQVVNEALQALARAALTPKP